MTMRHSDIPFAVLENCSDPNRWGADTDRDRLIYCDDQYFYKIWGKRFLETTMGAIGTEFVHISGLRRLHGFEVGLLRPDLCTALVEKIVDDEGVLRGYVTRRGKHPQKIPDDFVDRLFSATVTSGWAFSDLKPDNVIVVEGACSLIDYDTHLCSLPDIDVEFETQKGCLRGHVASRYREKIVAHLDQTRARRSPSGADTA